MVVKEKWGVNAVLMLCVFKIHPYICNYQKEMDLQHSDEKYFL